MTNPPGEGTPPERPEEPRPGQQPWEQPGASAPGEQPGEQPGASAPGDQPGGQPGEQPPGAGGPAEQSGYWEQQAQQQAQQPWQQPYQQPGYPAQPGQYVQDHPRATTSLVLGILGIVLCQIVAPFAWSMGKKTLDEIDASGGTVGGRGAAQAGYVLGIVGTVLLVLGVIFIVIWLVFMVAIVGGSMSGSSSF
jgi:Domain of unknown function (DUF4190)